MKVNAWNIEHIKHSCPTGKISICQQKYKGKLLKQMPVYVSIIVLIKPSTSKIHIHYPQSPEII
jgi:hypothetical protein